MKLTPLNLRILRLVYNYLVRYSAYASTGDIARITHRYRASIYEHFQRLADHHLIEPIKRGRESGWKITPQGYIELRKPPPKLKESVPPRHVRWSRGKMAERTKVSNLHKRLAAETVILYDPDTGLELID